MNRDSGGGGQGCSQSPHAARIIVCIGMTILTLTMFVRVRGEYTGHELYSSKTSEWVSGVKLLVCEDCKATTKILASGHGRTWGKADSRCDDKNLYC